MSLTIYRLELGDPLGFAEQFGDAVGSQGGAPVPAVRTALHQSVSLATLLPTEPETVAQRLKLRRQLRSLANNTPMKLTALGLIWSVDPEQNGWYLPDTAQVVDLDGTTGIATGVFKMDGVSFIKAGSSRTHRRAMWAYLKDLRAGLWARDYRRVIFSATEYSALATLALSYLPPGITDPLATGGGVVVNALPLPPGADGGQCNVASGLTDLARVSYEQPEASANKGQVIAYDRRGQQTGPTTGPGTLWEEFYGSDYPYSWLGPTPSEIDTPVLDNGRCRVRWDGTHTPGWVIDVWTGSKWEEQGKVNVLRIGDGAYDAVLLSAQLIEYNETRAVVQAVIREANDPASREEVFITLQRGWSGPRFEVYPGLTAAGERVDIQFMFTVALADADDSTMTINGGAGTTAATAKGTGHTGLFATESAGVPGENFLMLGRWGAPYGVIVALIQSGLTLTVESNSTAYGVARNAVLTVGNGKRGYGSLQLGYPAQNAQQALEAENMTLAAGTTNTADALASGGKAATAVREAEALHVSQANWPNSDIAVYRIFARVKTSASTLKIRAVTGAGTGAIKTTASTTYVWLDLGELGSTGTLEIKAWVAAAATLSVDRIEAYMVEDRNQASGGYQGGRDLGQSVLIDSRTIPTLVARSG